MKIYTRLGDQGFTTLANGKKLSKANSRVDCYGEVDELNAHLGYCRDLLNRATDFPFDELRSSLLLIQNDLFSIGSELALASGGFTPVEADTVKRMEEEIDRMWTKLPSLKNFVLPGGHEAASSLHIARTICRRAERMLVAIQNEEETIRPFLITYMNRLSDYLFCSARFVVVMLGKEEIIWRAKK